MELKKTLAVGLDAVTALRAYWQAKSENQDAALARISPDQLNTNNLQALVADEKGATAVQNLVADLLVWRRLQDQWTPSIIEEIEAAAVAAWAASENPILPVLKAASGLYAVGEASPVPIALAAMLSPKFSLDSPAARFRRDIFLVVHTALSQARRALESLVVSHLVKGWTTVLDTQGFALRSPLQFEPQIASALTETTSSGLRGAAKLVRVAAPAVGARLGKSWDQLLTDISGEGGS